MKLNTTATEVTDAQSFTTKINNLLAQGRVDTARMVAVNYFYNLNNKSNDLPILGEIRKCITAEQLRTVLADTLIQTNQGEKLQQDI
jgi:hypothetical protein